MAKGDTIKLTKFTGILSIMIIVLMSIGIFAFAEIGGESNTLKIATTTGLEDTGLLESLEKELKELKIEDASKARILLEKSANADRLIEALKQEIARLKKIKVERAQEPDSPPKDKIYVNSPLQLIRKRIERR